MQSGRTQSLAGEAIKPVGPSVTGCNVTSYVRTWVVVGGQGRDRTDLGSGNHSSLKLISPDFRSYWQTQMAKKRVAGNTGISWNLYQPKKHELKLSIPIKQTEMYKTGKETFNSLGPRFQPFAHEALCYYETPTLEFPWCELQLKTTQSVKNSESEFWHYRHHCN